MLNVVIVHFISFILSVMSIRYNHDSSETLEDNIEFTATDGTNSVSFVLQVKVIGLLQKWTIVTASHSWSFFAVRKMKVKTEPCLTKVTCMSSPGDAHQ